MLKRWYVQVLGYMFLVSAISLYGLRMLWNSGPEAQQIAWDRALPSAAFALVLFVASLGERNS